VGDGTAFEGALTMNTHSAKIFLAVIASMVALAVTSTSRPVFADDKRECAWTQIKEFGAPNIGTNGHIALTENWQKLSEDGWSLKQSDLPGTV